MTDKREMIERALGRHKAKADWMSSPFPLDLSTLTDQAIVIECEVEHILPGVDPVGCPNGWTIIDGIFNLPYPVEDYPHEEFRYEKEGIHGTPGKALAIIVPLEEE